MAIEPDIEDEEYVHRPDLCRRVLITFAEREDEFIVANGPRRFELEEHCYERAARLNYSQDKHPDLVDERVGPYLGFMEFGEKFLPFYRAYWNKQKAVEQTSKVARIATSTKAGSPAQLCEEKEG